MTDLRKKINNAYFTIYDLDDEFVAYCDNINELLNHTSLRKDDIVYKFKTKINDFILIKNDDSFKKIYMFDEEN